MKIVICALFLLLAFSLPLWAQHDVEFNGGYQHASGDQGLDGYTVGVAWNPIPRFQLYLNFDDVYDHSRIGAFELTSIGLTTVNSNMKEILTGPRFFLPGLWKGHGRVKGHQLIPWVDAGFGESRLHTELTTPAIGTASASDTAFAWELGGGADWRIYPHFTVRGDVGLLRTHFANSGQSRIRLGATLVWSFRSRAQ